MSIVKQSDLVFTIGLDADNVPSQITWTATDMPNGGTQQSCKAMLISLFDEKTRDTLKIDLWTKDLETQEMDRMMYQTLRALGDTYHRATKNTELANAMQQFAQYFGEQAEIIKKQV